MRIANGESRVQEPSCEEWRFSWEIRFSPVWSGLLGVFLVFLAFDLSCLHNASACVRSAASLVFLFPKRVASCAELPAPRIEIGKLVIDQFSLIPAERGYAFFLKQRVRFSVFQLAFLS